MTQLEQAFAMFRALGDDWFTATAAQRLADVHFARGHYRAGADWYCQSLELFAALGDEIGVADGLVRLGEIGAAYGQSECAARLLGAAQALHDAYSMTLLASLRAAYDAAVASIRAALGPDSFEEHWGQGRLMTVDAAVEEALDLERELPLGESIATPPKPRYPAGLSAREVEVLRLVAQGLTDAEVAERLFLSPRTVSQHLRSVYNKLGVGSRTAAMRFAVEQGLV
jgi:DNA-binding CsgD family transcriptional regulator